MIPEDKIICLIKKYRVESERLWSSITGYPDNYCRIHSKAYGNVADDLEKLLESDKEGEEI